MTMLEILNKELLALAKEKKIKILII